MEQGHFYRFGKCLYEFRWWVILGWLILTFFCMPFLPNIISAFKTTSFVNQHSQSAKTQKYLDGVFGDGTNTLLIIYHHDKWLATDSAFKNEISDSVAGLNYYNLKHNIIFPSDNKKQISKDKHTAYVVVIINNKNPINDEELLQFQELLKKPAHLSMQLGGQPAFMRWVNTQTKKDLYKSDFVATPVTLITLLLVFGSLIAAVVPLVLGGACAVIILMTLFCFGHLFSLSVYTINIALLLGLCLSLDYSLFIINRFRSELMNDISIEDAIAHTQATAGKAVFFSGLTVFVSLSALLFFPINILFSVGVGGLAAVFIAVAIAIVLLPAILAVLKTNINLCTINLFRRPEHNDHSPFWRGLATHVIRWRYFYSVFIIAFLLFLGLPFLHVKFGIADYKILPLHSESRAFFDDYNASFDGNDLSPIILVVQNKQEKITSKGGIDVLYRLTSTLQKNKLINTVNSIVTTDPRLTKEQYTALYSAKTAEMSDNIKTLLTTTTRQHMTVINLTSRYPVDSQQTKTLVSQLRELKLPSGWQVNLTGVPVNNLEVMQTIKEVLPYAIAWIMLLTYIALFFLLRSLYLPFKAIIMNILSLTASYGMLVFIIQEGHFHRLLNFEPQGMLDISLLIIIFCALFGFSMDYEVFLLTRIKESYEKYQDNNKSIIFGIEHSSRIITSAAIIVIIICCSFMFAEILMVKAFGLGIAVAIFVDAFLIRTLLVPSIMAITRKWNWYIPKWLH